MDRKKVIPMSFFNNIFNIYRDFIVGIICVICLCFVFMFYENTHNMTQGKKNDKYFYYNFNISSVEGLEISDPVRLSGVEVGRIINISLSQNYTPNVTIAVNKDLEIPDDSSIVISSTSILDSHKIVNLVLGININILSDGDSIFYATSAVSFNQLLDLASKTLKIEKNEKL